MGNGYTAAYQLINCCVPGSEMEKDTEPCACVPMSPSRKGVSRLTYNKSCLVKHTNWIIHNIHRLFIVKYLFMAHLTETRW